MKKSGYKQESPDKDTAVILHERSAHEPNTSWWLEPAGFYTNARVRAPFMKLSRFGQHQIFTTGKDSER